MGWESSFFSHQRGLKAGKGFMELNVLVSNPMLVGCIELMKADNSTEHRDLFLKELMNAKLMCPVKISPAPEMGEDGKYKLTQENKVQFPMLGGRDGKKFFMAFTDKMEYEKLKKEEGTAFAALVLDEYAGMVLRKDAQAEGVVLNPLGANIVLPKEMLGALMAQKLASLKK